MLADLGSFVDAHSALIGDIDIDQRYDDNGSLGITDANLFTGVSANSVLRFTKAGTVVNDLFIKSAGHFRGSAAGTALTIGNNPITSGTIGTPTFSVASTGHGVVANQNVVIQGSAAVDGIPAVQINRGHCVTSITDANNFVCTVETNCTAGGVTGGGAGVTAAKDQAFLNITGLGTGKGKLAFPTELYDRGSSHSPTLYEYTVPYTGTYRLEGYFFVTFAAGTRIRVYFYKNIHTAAAIVGRCEYRCQGSGAERVTFQCWSQLTIGDKVSINADQNTAAAAAPTISDISDFQWAIQAL